MIKVDKEVEKLFKGELKMAISHAVKKVSDVESYTSLFKYWAFFSVFALGNPLYSYVHLVKWHWVNNLNGNFAALLTNWKLSVPTILICGLGVGFLWGSVYLVGMAWDQLRKKWWNKYGSLLILLLFSALIVALPITDYKSINQMSILGMVNIYLLVFFGRVLPNLNWDTFKRRSVGGDVEISNEEELHEEEH